MSSKEQKTPEGQAPEEIIMDQHEEIEAVEPEASAEQVDPRDEKSSHGHWYCCTRRRTRSRSKSVIFRRRRST